MRRGDNIPPVSDYAHWNEDAELVWYAENRYDMEHADEEIEDDRDDRYDPDPFVDEFATEAEAWVFVKKWEIDVDRDTISEWGGKWYVEHWVEKAHVRSN